LRKSILKKKQSFLRKLKESLDEKGAAPYSDPVSNIRDRNSIGFDRPGTQQQVARSEDLVEKLDFKVNKVQLHKRMPTEYNGFEEEKEPERRDQDT